MRWYSSHLFGSKCKIVTHRPHQWWESSHTLVKSEASQSCRVACHSLDSICRVIDNVRRFGARGLKKENVPWIERLDNHVNAESRSLKNLHGSWNIDQLLCIKCNASHVWCTHLTRDITGFLNFLICFHLFSVHHLF